MRASTVTRGSLKGTLSQVAWHSDGSYYIDGQAGHFWIFETVTTRAGWSKLWKRQDTSPKELSELVVSVLDSSTQYALTLASLLLLTRMLLLERLSPSFRGNTMHRKRRSLSTSTKTPRTQLRIESRHPRSHPQLKIHVYSISSESHISPKPSGGPSEIEPDVRIQRGLGSWNLKRKRRSRYGKIEDGTGTSWKVEEGSRAGFMGHGSTSAAARSTKTRAAPTRNSRRICASCYYLASCTSFRRFGNI